MFLVDTNVISEARKGAKADRGVRAFFDVHAEDGFYLAVQTIGELRLGVERIRLRGDTGQALLLEKWLERLLRDYADRILGFDPDCAQVWGRLMASGNQNPIDKQIAAIALIHDLTVATRNVADFSTTGVRLVNPFG